jgi:hypothetical protein
MKESYVEGLATHDDPESCVAPRKGGDEAWTGGRGFARKSCNYGTHREVQGHTPMMNESGKTDRPVVPEKSPNKAGPPAAEGMEGRGPTRSPGFVGDSGGDRTPSRLRVIRTALGVGSLRRAVRVGDRARLDRRARKHTRRQATEAGGLLRGPPRPLDHHYEENAAFVPTTNPAHAPAVEAVPDSHGFEQPKELGLDFHGNPRMALAGWTVKVGS